LRFAKPVQEHGNKIVERMIQSVQFHSGKRDYMKAKNQNQLEEINLTAGYNK
jgi:hypothetical protein